jgi:hypothetical protein
MVRLINGCTHHTINVDGEVINTETGKSKSIWVSKIGYPCVSISEHGSNKNLYIHRIVAEAFIPNPEGKKTVNHIDGDKTNNFISNLEWATFSENMAHAYSSGLQPYRRKYQLSEYEDILVNRFLLGETLTSISNSTNQGLTQLSYHLREAAERLGIIKDYENSLISQKLVRAKNAGMSKRQDITLNMIDKTNGNIIKIFNNITEAVQYLKVKSAGPISNVLSGRQKSAYGYFWVKS